MTSTRNTPATSGRHRARTKEKIHRRPRRSRHRGCMIRGVLAGLAGLGLLVFLDAAWVATTASRELVSTRDLLERGASALVEGRIDDAEVAFGLASASADRAVDALDHPTGVIGGRLPVIGDDVRAVKNLAAASELGARAGSSLVLAAGAAGWQGSTAVALDDGGPYQPTALAAASPDLDSASGFLAEAKAALTGISLEGLSSPVRDAVVSAGESLGGTERVVRSAAIMGHLLPTFLGGEEARDYLLVSLNLSDPRGSGGYPGTYSVLQAKDGKLSLNGFGATSELGVVPPVAAPPDVERRYQPFGALTNFIASTYPPDFPTSARLMLQMWEATGREPLDGVIAVDSVWTSYLLAATGPVETPVWPEPITAENVSTVINHDTFLTSSKVESDRMQDAIGNALLSEVLQRPIAPSAAASALARAVSERHAQIYSSEPGEEQLLEQLGAAGRLDLGANPLVVAWNGAVGSRAGYFAEKSVDYRAELQTDGSAQVTIEITLSNPAPSSPPSILLGFPGDGVPIGTYEAYANVYLPEDAKGIRARVAGEQGINLIEEEFGRPVVLQLLGAAPGEDVTGTISYRLPNALTSVGEDRVFTLDLLPLPALRPDQVSVEIVAPQGTAVLQATAPMTISGSEARYEGVPVSPTSLSVVVDPPT